MKGAKIKCCECDDHPNAVGAMDQLILTLKKGDPFAAFIWGMVQPRVQQTTNNKQQTTNNKQQTTNNKQQTRLAS
jgi:hypothetical protein